MADVNPQTTFNLALNEREFNTVMLALAFAAGAAVKPDSEHRQLASDLNLQLLELSRQTFAARLAVVEKKLAKVTPPPTAGAR